MSESFEDEVPTYTAQLPSATLEAEQEYPRGTILNLNVQVRVIGFTENEDKKGNLIHKHNLALEEVSIIDFLTPAQRKALIEAAEREAEEQARLLAGGTIPEEEHIEDVLPGQTTIEEQLAAHHEEWASGRMSHEGEDDEEDEWSRAVKESAESEPEQLHRELTATKVEIDDDDPDLDHEHDWMDDEDEDYDGLRIEVGF